MCWILVALSLSVLKSHVTGPRRERCLQRTTKIFSRIHIQIKQEMFHTFKKSRAEELKRQEKLFKINWKNEKSLEVPTIIEKLEKHAIAPDRTSNTNIAYCERRLISTLVSLCAPVCCYDRSLIDRCTPCINSPIFCLSKILCTYFDE